MRNDYGNQSKVYKIVTQSHTKVFTKPRKEIIENPKICGKKFNKIEPLWLKNIFSTFEKNSTKHYKKVIK
jgi:hypothetical protein